MYGLFFVFFFFSSRRRHTRLQGDWSSDVCSSDLHVRGRLAEGRDAFDVLEACFPAGTLTGAPKIRAMEIIEELEPTRRGPYGGAVGYISYSGTLDSCITIRTVVCHGGRASIQVGAGIVADSDPKTEWLETCSKARGMLLALRVSQQTGR